MKPLKIAYFGTGDFSKNILADICENFNEQIQVELVVSQPDKKIWRKQILTPTPVAGYAKEPSPSGERELISYLKKLDLDFIVVVAYGKIIPIDILEIPEYGCINIHGSILPKYRWASPIQESLKNWDTTTWLTIMYMSEGMDEWDVLKIREIEVDKLDKTPEMFTKFEHFWAELLVETLEWVITWEIKWVPQNDDKATYCSKISKTDGEIDFKTMSADEIYNMFRAYYPWPGIYCFYWDKKLNIEDCSISPNLPSGEGSLVAPWQVIKLDKKTIGVVCADKKILVLKQVKLEWKKSMDILSFINGNKDFLDYKF